MEGTTTSGGLSFSQKETMADYAAHNLATSLEGGKPYIGIVPEVRGYDYLFVTLRNRTELRCVERGYTDINDFARTKKDIDDAITRCISNPSYKKTYRQGEVNDMSIALEIYYNRRAIPFERLSSEIELGIHGIEVRTGGKEAFFRSIIPIEYDLDLEETLQSLCKQAGAEKDCYEHEDTQIFAFHSITFIRGADGTLTELYRSNVLVPTESIDRNMIVERLYYSFDWFTQHSSVYTLHYQYYPSKDTYSSSNNDVRQMATLWAMARLQRFFGEETYTDFIGRGITYYLNMTACTGTYCFVQDGDGGKIANNAFMILTLLEMPEYPDGEYYINQYANGLLQQQQDNGRYKTFFEYSMGGGEDYYPGESMLALMELYYNTNDSKYLQSVERAFPYYRAYWRGNPTTAFIPWHSQAYILLYNITHDPELASFVFEMNDWLIDNHQITEGRYEDEIGGMPLGTPRCSTSSYLEGLADAYRLAVMVNDTKHIRKYEGAIRAGVRYILLTQYTPENSFYLKRPELAIGGFRYSLESNNERIDYTQHAVMALLKLSSTDIFV